MGMTWDKREALAAPTNESSMYIQSVIILIVSITSLLGAAWIILSFICFKNLRSFRHHLTLGLAISDFLMAANFISSTALNVAGKYIGAPEQATFCSFNGFMTQVFVIQTDYWVLTIAICTYIILADHKRMSSWIQDQRLFLSFLPWAFSVLWAGVGLKLAGYGDIGAWCWFTSDKVRLFANFVPRWIIVATILGMYARLYYVLYRAHKRFVSFGHVSSDPKSASRDAEAAVVSNRSPAGLTNNTNYESRSRYGGERTNKKLKMVARLMLMYPVAYMLIWTLPTAVRIYQTTQGSPAPFALQTVDKSCIVLQGLIDAIIYGVNEPSLSSWRNLLFPDAFPNIDGVNAPRPGNSNQGMRHNIPCTRLDDTMPGDSTSSLEMTLSATDSTARITRDSTDVGTKSREKDSGIELKVLTQATSARIRTTDRETYI
ncbi:Fc.00g093660.m01.CDS01 [Cosmosporella sp. VM-42]